MTPIPKRGAGGRFVAGGGRIAKSRRNAMHWKGDKAEFTGRTKEMDGAKWNEIRLLEGHLKGETKWVPASRGTQIGIGQKRNRKKNAAELIIFNPRKRVKLTDRQKQIWENYFAFYVQDEGKSDAAADRLAWRDLVSEYPELKKSGGAKNPRGGYAVKWAAGSYSMVFGKKSAADKYLRRSKKPGEVIAVAPGHDFKNPKGRRRKKLNPDEMQQAIALYEKFHGADPSKILEVQESAAMRSTYAGLGDLVELLVKCADGRTVRLSFEGDKIKAASNSAGTQIYFLGGNQNLNGSLAEFDADTTKDFVELGECVRIMYFTRKEADGFQPVDYHHKFGEEGGARPVLIYNKVQKRMILAGGSYTVEAPGIIN